MPQGWSSADIAPMVFAAVGVIGSIASIVALFISAPTPRQRIIHGVYGVTIALCAALAFWSTQRLSQVERIDRAAREMLADLDFNYTHGGQIEGILVFLEKVRNTYPDAYSHAQEISRGQRGCCATDSACKIDQIDAASRLKGILRAVETTTR